MKAKEQQHRASVMARRSRTGQQWQERSLSAIAVARQALDLDYRKHEASEELLDLLKNWSRDAERRSIEEQKAIKAQPVTAVAVRRALELYANSAYIEFVKVGAVQWGHKNSQCENGTSEFYLAFAFFERRMHVAYLGLAAPLERDVREARVRASNPHLDCSMVLNRLYTRIWEPLASVLIDRDGKWPTHVILCPDAALSEVPLELAMVPNDSEHVLERLT